MPRCCGAFLFRNPLPPYLCKRMRTMTCLIGSVCLALLTGCERSVDFRLDETEPRLVVEATIENGQPPVVTLSRSLSFFTTIDLQALSSSFVHDAEVTVSNGIRTHRLREYAVPIAPGIRLYYYSTDSTSPATSFLGELNGRYSLQVRVGGKVYTATTTIPNITRQVDSVFWRPAPAGNPPGKVSFMLAAYDRPGFGDYIRYFTRRNSEPFLPGFNSVYDDQVIDGTRYTVQVDRGFDRNAPAPEAAAFFDRGDTVTLKLSNIDKATFDFWRTMEFNYVSIGNPFSTPTRVSGTISGGALGYFGGYASQFHTLIIPR